MHIPKHAIALLLVSTLGTAAFAQSPQLTVTQVTERLAEWDQGYARLRRDIWNMQRGTAMFERDFRGRMLSDDLREFALTAPQEQQMAELRALVVAQSDKGEQQQATVTLISLYRRLRDELELLDRIGEHRIRLGQVIKQRTLWQQLAATVPGYQVPDTILNLEQQAIEQLNTGAFEQTSRTTYRALLQAYAGERELLVKRGARNTAAPIYYDRRSACGEPAQSTTGKPIPAVISTTQPEYPPTSKRAEEEGAVYLQLLVGKHGCVLRYAIQHSSGWPRLDDAALDWSETVRFSPGVQDGKATEAWVTMPVVFRLDD